ncbi:peptidase inhibitor family I36 protein [Actinoplanes siamensis]|uniref:Peptidase inhibitor family I36 n=1 Tax=Actinoplanes siamensis TaxID=1223317 RepID=A0A919TPN2_9ACTN|nr:peptidase inhibitor family I36 protein [Actinoplanes siamensis]GIF09308.1 hypothetical protein Asi03nite_68460 [Actinoplanes siamensis]
MSLIRKATSYFAAAVLSAAGITFAGAAPAQAASWTDCPAGDSGWVCLWEGPNYTGGRWQASKAVLEGGQSGGVYGCHNLTDAHYTNGKLVYDTASSWAIRPIDYTEQTLDGNVTFYEWINCNNAGKHRTYRGYGEYAVGDLSTLSPSFNDTVASILISYN